MRIVSLKLRNWACYRGDHLIENLGAKAYAIVARLETNAERSNYLGKSSIMEAIRFGLFGVHRHRLDEGWITKGEQAGEVRLEFDDGTIIRRTKVISKSERLYVQEPGVPPEKAAVQAEAQAIIERRVGMNDADFIATSYFEQKQMARLIVAKPSDRMAIIAAWLNLDPLILAEGHARAHATKLADEADIIDRSIAVEQGMIAQNTGDLAGVEGGFPNAIEKAKAIHWDADENLANAKVAYENAHALLRQFDQADRFVSVRDAGVALQAELDALPAEDVERGQKLVSTARALQSQADVYARDIDAKSLVVVGQFDGRCPVIPIPCPAQQKINDLSAVAKKEVKRLTIVRDDFEKQAEVAREGLRALQEVESKRTQMGARLERMAEEARALQAARRAVKGAERPDVESHRETLARLQNAAMTARGAFDSLVVRAKAIELSNAKIEKLRSERLAKAEQLATAREALVILGKNGAQRRVAESALAAIEEGANDLLAKAGVDLTIEVLWSREGREGEFADHCAECGNPFPASKKVRECLRCNAARGPKVLLRLDIELSDRSGAAEDLAGIALQLSASAWLRSARNIAWSVALIDEPFSACDKANRRALSAHLTSMLSAYGYSQAFVVAHDAQSVDALPGRLQILSDGERVLSIASV